MNYVFEFVNNLIYFTLLVYIGYYFFGFERRYRKYGGTLFLGIILVLTLGWFQLSITSKMIAHIASAIIILYLFFKEESKLLLVAFLDITFTLTMLEVMLRVLSSKLCIYLQLPYAAQWGELSAKIVLFLFIVCFGNFSYKRHAFGLKNVELKYLLLFIGILFVDAWLVLFLGELMIEGLQGTRKIIGFVVYLGLVVNMLVQISLLINAMVTRRKSRESELYAKQYLESQKEHYLYLESRDTRTKKFRHDIKTHLFMLREYMEKEDFDAAKKYLQTLNDKASEIGNPINVSNGIADAILNKFYAEAKEKGIEIKVKGHFPMTCYISAYDICTVLSNIMSNAISAECECGGNSVLVDIRYIEDDVVIVVENDYNHELTIENGVFKTTKTDSFIHGYGLKNVQECVEKSGGYMSITTDNQRFKVMLCMKNENEEDE